ncbi:MAG: helix-turn-helix domain-containing protein [Pseudomonadota bacterium]
MDYLDMKYALAKKGYTLTKLADEMGLFGPQSVQQVLTRKYISAHVEKRVAEITGIPLEQLFPDRYQPAKHSTGSKRTVKDCPRETKREPRERKPSAHNH